MVTAELAACLPVLILLLGVALSAVSVASARLRAQDAAREAARSAARATSSTTGGPGGVQVPGAMVSVTSDGTLVRAAAQVSVHLLVPFLPPVTVTERAVAAREPP